MNKVLLTFFFVFVFLFFSSFAFAQTEATYPSILGIESPQEIIESSNQEEAFPLFMGYIFHFFLFISALVVFGVLFYSFILYYLSSENPEKKRNAKNWTLSALHGGFIIISSYTLLLLLDSRMVIFTPRDLMGAQIPQAPEIEWERQNAFFQIPFGLLMEDAVLSESAKEKISNILNKTEETKKSLTLLHEENEKLIRELEEYSENCFVGSSCVLNETTPSKESSKEEIKTFLSSFLDFFSATEVFGVTSWSKGGILEEQDSLREDIFYEKEEILREDDESTTPPTILKENDFDKIRENISSCTEINPQLEEKINQINIYTKETLDSLENLHKAKKPLEEDLYHLYKSVIMKSLLSEDLISYNDFLLKRHVYPSEEIFLTTSTEKTEIGPYYWDWQKWLYNTTYKLERNGNFVAKNDPIVFYVEENFAKDALITAKEIAREAKEKGIQDAGARISIPRDLPPPPIDTRTTLYPPVSPDITRITSPFGSRRDPFTGRVVFHRGLDLAGPRNTPIFAAEEGEVIFSGWAGSQTTGYGKLIIIYHSKSLHNDLEEDLVTYYAHLEPGSLQVKRGDNVRRGEYIAGMGTTGRSTGYHLHYEVRKNVSYPFVIHTGKQVNPAPFIDTERWYSFLENNFLPQKNNSFSLSNILQPFSAKEVFAKSDTQTLDNYLLENNIDPRFLSEEELYEIIDKLEIERREASSFLELSEREGFSDYNNLFCGEEIPVGEAFELSWRYLVSLVDEIDYYIDEVERLLKQQKLINNLSSSCTCYCKKEDNEGVCFFDCPLEEIKENNKKIKETKKAISKTKEKILLLTDGYFNKPSENICHSLNEDIRTDEESLTCQEEEILIPLQELISRKLNYSRYMFDGCITRPEDLDSLKDYKNTPQSLIYGPITEEKDIPRYTKTKRGDNIINTSYLNWFCCFKE